MLLKKIYLIADIEAAAGRVIIHAKPIGFISAQLVSLLTIPMPSTAPTKVCVLDTGSPMV